MPRKRKQTARYGNQDLLKDMSDLETSDSDEDYDGNGVSRGNKKLKSGKLGRPSRRGRRPRGDEDFEFEDVPEGCFARSDCFKVEKNLLVYGYVL